MSDIPVYGRKLTTAMARSKLDEHHMKEVPVEDVEPGELVDVERTLTALYSHLELSHVSEVRRHGH